MLSLFVWLCTEKRRLAVIRLLTPKHKDSSAEYVSHDIVARPRNRFAVETTMHPVCVVELQFTVNCITTLSAAQQCF